MPDITLEQFEAEATSFLDSNASLKAEEKKFVWGEGSDKVTLFDEKARKNELEELAKAQAWRQKKFDAGFGWITGPSAYGGRELSQAYDRRGPSSRTSTRCRTKASSASASAWSRPRSSPTRADDGEGQVPEGAVAGRHRRLPAVQRARCGQRPRLAADPRRARRRRVDHQRPEGLDIGRAVQRHRRDHHPQRSRHAQAQGPDGLHRRHARAAASRCVRCGR